MTSFSAKKWDKSHFPIHQIKVATENNFLYDNFAIANHDDLTLFQSIKEVGIQEPLVITLDNYLLSGHRRISCAKRLRLETVPVRIIDKIFESLDKTERLALLRLYNQQRDKSTGEKIREKLLEIDKSTAYSNLLMRRVDILTASGGIKSNIKLNTETNKVPIIEI